ncbi:hypothetical protein P168DRAFT_306199 [Aspergillus campestris IBT 28561]|uniref:Uncharacterized protein n=1 Tax=Aspergillus campestris (strain IBT 28561) TaxID=1392248 RepID=A0A2I1CWG9_ASPC2|nr:uncharacterized protein P168DRAFT_306199 [Aspergillus campestris IBT 28561]PKY01960.1 hypothetical protein P168DRAFT_306199 [Aspergillus campestris IBT 28561]
MPPPRITAFFRRPDFATTNDDRTPAKKGPAAAAAAATTPRPPPSTLLADASPDTPDGPGVQLNTSLLSSVPDRTHKEQHLKTPGKAEPPAKETTLGLNPVHHALERGEKVVADSEGDDTESVESFEDPEDLFLKFGNPSPNDGPHDGPDVSRKHSSLSSAGRGFRIGSLSQYRGTAPTYTNTLDSLVTEAVGDKETEATIAQLRATLEVKPGTKGQLGGEGGRLNEGVLTSALDGEDNGPGLRRLLDAVRRTEAFDIEKSWSFFDYQDTQVPTLPFPRKSISPGTYIGALLEPESRERAFHSGVVDFALSKGLLPDELVKWILLSVPSEPREGVRHAYCRALKHLTAERIQSIIRPKTIDELFQRLGTSVSALSISETITPQPLPPHDALSTASQKQEALLSVLNLLGEVADRLSDDTREHVLSILFRIALDVTLTSNPILCSEIEKTINEILLSMPGDAVELANTVCTTAHATIQDPIFQSRLLTHIIPTTERIATLRYRLAVSFLSKDATLLTQPPDKLHDLRRTVTLLKDKRFNVKRYKKKGANDYDYGELGGIITLLNVSIDSGWSGVAFVTKDAEREYNAAVDTLADRIRRIFTSIEDSGASHLKRTLAKEAMEALHYRILYSVRTKPRPKKGLFGVYATSDNGDTKMMDRYTAQP